PDPDPAERLVRCDLYRWLLRPRTQLPELHGFSAGLLPVCAGLPADLSGDHRDLRVRNEPSRSPVSGGHPQLIRPRAALRIDRTTQRRPETAHFGAVGLVSSSFLRLGTIGCA